jgi:hypothetical protein
VVPNCIKIDCSTHIESIGLIQLLSGLFYFNKSFFSLDRVEFDMKVTENKDKDIRLIYGLHDLNDFYTIMVFGISSLLM